MDLNKVIVAGRLTGDPEFKQLENSQLATFSLAMNRRWKDNGGETREEACFIGVKVFGKRAETIRKFFHKGDNILVEGHLRQESWEKDGEKRSKHVIMLDNFSFVDSKPKGGNAPQGENVPGDEEIPF
jgi:single-strand DNA-binding protein